jgi:arsenite methyltransferase
LKYFNIKELFFMDTKQNEQSIRGAVREHYGNIAKSANQKQAAGCCGPQQSSSNCCFPSDTANAVKIDSSTIYVADDIQDLPDDVTDLSLGCGDPVTLANLKPGETVLDLGAGGGIDCFLAAKRVGPTGHVIGVDMTPEMLEKAWANKKKLGADNVEFRLGEIEHLPVADNTVDVIISNCVINLSPDKNQVFREAFRVLKSGGKFAVSDIVTDGLLPEQIRSSLEEWAGCVAGALDIKEYLDGLKSAGFEQVDVRPVYFDQATIDQAKAQIADKGGQVVIASEDISKKIFSAKITAWKP